MLVIRQIALVSYRATNISEKMLEIVGLQATADVTVARIIHSWNQPHLAEPVRRVCTGYGRNAR
jgi:hypothetical protein